jgi:tRNA(Ile)-lysidine synthase
MANSRKLNSVNSLLLSDAGLPPAGSAVLVGLSGGVDSVVLLHLFSEFAPRYSWQLAAIHVHHGISANADRWAEFCTDLCARLEIPLHVERVDIAPLRAHGVEAAARRLRYAAFTRQTCDYVALAHHADDQVETLFLQLLRGAGVRGASAMPLLSACTGTHKVIRPLLHCTRDQIVEYAGTHDLHWIEDESNADEIYPRNFLRHQLLPKLAEKFPAYRETLTRSARHFAEAAELLDDLARLDAQNLSLLPCGERAGERGEGGEFYLAVSALQALNAARAKNLLRYFLHERGAPMPQVVQLDDMLQQLCTAREDAAVCIRFAAEEWQVRRYQGRVYVLRAQRAFERNLVLSWQGEDSLDWPATGARIAFEPTIGQGVSVAKLARAALTLRLRQGGESLRPAANAANRTLKNLLQERHIPPWQRERWPLLYCGETLVCVAGVAIAADYQACENEPGILLKWLNG